MYGHKYVHVYTEQKKGKGGIAVSKAARLPRGAGGGGCQRREEMAGGQKTGGGGGEETPETKQGGWRGD